MLYLELHDLHLRTFPQGSFRHTIISSTDANKLIEKALTDDDFYGAFKHDNLNPKKADKRFDEFVTAMEQHCGIKLPIDKFFNKEIMEDGETLTFGNPAGLAILEKGDVLLVVDYAFSAADTSEKLSGKEWLNSFTISPDTIEFHAFEMIDTAA